MSFRETESTEEADEPAEPYAAADSDLIGLLDNYGRVPAIARQRCSYAVGGVAHDAHVVWQSIWRTVLPSVCVTFSLSLVVTLILALSRLLCPAHSV